MISLKKKLEVFSLFQLWLEQFLNNWSGNALNRQDLFVSNIQSARHYNQWIVEPFVIKCLEQWVKRLTPESLFAFIDKYPEVEYIKQQKTIAVIPKENVPLDGLHDLICVLLAGHKFVGRNFNHTSDLVWYLSQKLIDIEPSFNDSIFWYEKLPKNVDKYLVYANLYGSNAWKEYLSKKDSLIRNQSISLGVITSEDDIDDYELLGCDISDYFGQSSYNVRKLFVPESFTIQKFFPAMEKYSFIYQYNRYANNYDYQRSILMMDLKPFFENGFLIMRETAEHAVPIGCLHYEFYKSEEDLKTKLNNENVHIQQIISNSKSISNAVLPGSATSFSLYDFEDHQDTMKFLLK